MEISGLRILYNSFLNWRRAPLSLHNVTDVNVIGNYFGPPITNDNLVPAAPELAAALAGSNVLIGWISPSPGFWLQQIGNLAEGPTNWLDVPNPPVLAGESNLVTITLTKGSTNQFYRA